jgi:hypothetical protein
MAEDRQIEIQSPQLVRSALYILVCSWMIGIKHQAHDRPAVRNLNADRSVTGARRLDLRQARLS